MLLSFKVSREVAVSIELALERYLEICERHNVKDINRFSLHMDLTACHANGCPMDWDRLLKADDFTFVHDVGGICRHINRDTGKLENCFFPRCAIKTESPE